MQQSILILGAGLMQKPAIESAKSLGLKVFIIDANENAACVPLADVFKKIDLKSKEEIASYAIELKQKSNLVAIFTAGTDFSTSVAYASEKAGLLSHSFQASLNASDKTLMRECFEKFKVPSPKFIRISEEDKNESFINQFINSVNFPLVVKPVDNMGARGCRMIRNFDELNFSVNEAIKYSRSKNCILEEYMQGPEYSIDALVYDGTMTITGFADRHIFFEPYFIELGHTMPTSLLTNSMQYEQLIKTFASGVKALGLTRGAAKADIKFTKDGAMIGEIAARLSGGYMSGWTFPYSSDLNLTKAAIQIACGQKPIELENARKKIIFSNQFFQNESINSGDFAFELFEVPCKNCSAERAWISIPGVVKNIHKSENFKNKEFIKNIFPRVNEGDKVVFPRNNVEKCGNVISQSVDKQSAIFACESIIKNITLELEPNNLETTQFLTGKKLSFEQGFPPNAFNFPIKIINELNIELSEAEKNNKEILKNKSVSEYIPIPLLSEEIQNTKDWNYLSLKEVIARFDKLRPNHQNINYKKFWLYVIYGSIQGALYAAD